MALMGETKIPNVLVVDDHNDLLKFATQALQRAGYAVANAGSAEEALVVTRAIVGELDLLITDLMLPGMTGGELRERIREMHPNCAAIYMSGANQKRIDELGLKYGATFLHKPFTAKQLVEAAGHKLAFTRAAFL